MTHHPSPQADGDPGTETVDVICPACHGADSSGPIWARCQVCGGDGHILARRWVPLVDPSDRITG